MPGQSEEFDTIHSDVLLFFPELVRELGGDPDALLEAVGLPRFAAVSKLRVGYRLLSDILGRAARDLACPDFGMRLAAMQGGVRAAGALGSLVRSAKTFGDAAAFAQDNAFTHSLACQVSIKACPETGLHLITHDVLLENLPNKCQAIEQVLLLAHLIALEVTGGKACARRVLFRHLPISDRRTYRKHFGCDVLFEQRDDGVAFTAADLQAPTISANPASYRRAEQELRTRFAHRLPPMHARVRGKILQFLGTRSCDHQRVAEALKLHPRTMHRRLTDEGQSFRQVKDGVRRDLALYYLLWTNMHFKEIAEKVGLSEQSAFSRSCCRWFSSGPKELRLHGSVQLSS